MKSKFKADEEDDFVKEIRERIKRIKAQKNYKVRHYDFFFVDPSISSCLTNHKKTIKAIYSGLHKSDAIAFFNEDNKDCDLKKIKFRNYSFCREEFIDNYMFEGNEK